MSFALLLDAAYSLDVEEDVWVRDLCVHARPLLDDGHGVFAYSYGVIADRVRLDSLAIEGEGASKGLWDSLHQWGARNQSAVLALYRAQPVQIVSFASVASSSKTSLQELNAAFESQGVQNTLAFVAHHRAGSGVILTVPQMRRRSASRALERTFADVGSALAAIVRLRRQRPAARRSPTLSPTERLVAQLLLSGCSDKEIAHDLAIAMSTVSTLTARIRQKVGCDAGEELLHLAEPDTDYALDRRRRLFEALTPAEREVAVELVGGARYDDIARERGCAERTVAAQATSIFRKVGLSGRRELAAAVLGGSRRENDDGASARIARR